MKLYYFETLNPRKACAVARYLGLPVGSFPEIERWHARLDELPAWRQPLPEARAAAA